MHAAAYSAVSTGLHANGSLDFTPTNRPTPQRVHGPRADMLTCILVQQELRKRESPISELAIIEWSEKLHRKHAAVETPRAVLVAGCDIELSRVISIWFECRGRLH